MSKDSRPQNSRPSRHQAPPSFLQIPLRVRSTWLVPCFLLLGFVLVGCSASPIEGTPLSDGELQPTRTPAPFPTLTPEPTEPPQTTISIWLDWEYQELQSLYAVIERYQRVNPGVEFAITYRPRNKLLAAFENSAVEGTRPSVLLGPSSWGPTLRQKGLILNISPLLDPGMETDVHPIAWTQAADGTQLLGLPLELQGMVLYRNRALVAQPVADLEDWLKDGDQLRDQGRGAIIPDLELEVSLPMMAVCDQEVYDERGELRIFGDNGECWLSFLARLGELGDAVFSSDEDLERFKQGQVAWVIASTEMGGELVDAVGITNLEVDPWPVYSGTGFPLRGYTWSENIYLVAGSTESDLEASWKFVRFLFGEEGQTILSDPGGAAHIPTTSKVEPPDSMMVNAASMLRAGMPMPLNDELDLLREPLTAAIRAVVLQGADPAFALRLAEERYELLLATSATP